MTTYEVAVYLDLAGDDENYNVHGVRAKHTIQVPLVLEDDLIRIKACRKSSGEPLLINGRPRIVVSRGLHYDNIHQVTEIPVGMLSNSHVVLVE